MYSSKVTSPSRSVSSKADGGIRSRTEMRSFTCGTPCHKMSRSGGRTDARQFPLSSVAMDGVFLLQAESGRRGGKEHLWKHSPRKSCLLLCISGPRMASQLATAVETLISVFYKYSSREGDKYKLSKKELKELLQKELGVHLETPRDPEVLDKIMHDLDENCDEQVSFNEYLMLVAALMRAGNPFFSEET